MRRIGFAVSAVVLFVAVSAAYAAWMTNLNHHCQVRIPNGWNVEHQVIVKGDKTAQVLLANPEEDDMVAAIFSMEVEQPIEIADLKAIFESMMLKNPKIVEEQKRGFNNLKGVYVIYEAEFEGTPLKLMCFFTKKDPYLYAVFTGTLADKFDEKKTYLDELLVTFQFVK